MPTCGAVPELVWQGFGWHRPGDQVCAPWCRNERDPLLRCGFQSAWPHAKRRASYLAAQIEETQIQGYSDQSFLDKPFQSQASQATGMKHCDLIPPRLELWFDLGDIVEASRAHCGDTNYGLFRGYFLGCLHHPRKRPNRVIERRFAYHIEPP